MELTPAEEFDAWYADMNKSTARDELKRRTLGLPPELESSSLLSWQGIAEVAEALQLQQGQTLVDLACGRGGYGHEVAERAAAHLIGVDFSTVAVERARERAAERGIDARYVVGDLQSTGLETASADAIMCIDSIQFAPSTVAALKECLRVLRPGGRLVITCWEGRDRSDEQVPERIRDLDLTTSMNDAGFAHVMVEERPGWVAAERAMWEAAIEADPQGDPAVASLKEEAEYVLPQMGRVRRVMARGTAPAR